MQVKKLYESNMLFNFLVNTNANKPPQKNYAFLLMRDYHTYCSQSHNMIVHHTTTTVLWPFFRDHLGEPVTEENFWTLWCKGRLTEAVTQIIRLGATPAGLTSAHLHHPPMSWLSNEKKLN